MPNPREIAVITVNGQQYRDWESVLVIAEFGTLFRTFRFSVSEQADVKRWTDLQLKPGDECTVTLGGQLAVTGFVYERQLYLDAQRHGVLSGDVLRAAADLDVRLVEHSAAVQRAFRLRSPGSTRGSQPRNATAI
jgi:prophage tail gpP-like protein